MRPVCTACGQAAGLFVGPLKTDAKFVVAVGLLVAIGVGLGLWIGSPSFDAVVVRFLDVLTSPFNS